MIEWREIPGYPEYKISDAGQVRRAIASQSTQEGKILKPYKIKSGYLYVNLSQNSRSKPYSVHRLVVLAFIGESPSDEHQIVHNDGNFENNHVSNLKWAPWEEIQRLRYLRSVDSQDENHHKVRLTDSDVYEIRDMVMDGCTQKYVAEKYSVSSSTVNDIIKGRSWSWLK